MLEVRADPASAADLPARTSPLVRQLGAGLALKTIPLLLNMSSLRLAMIWTRTILVLLTPTCSLLSQCQLPAPVPGPRIRLQLSVRWM